MHIFFACLATLTTLCFAAALFFITVDAYLPYHTYFGLMAAVSCLLTHCWVFFYFIGTGEGIREGILDHGLDRKAIKTTKRFKGIIFPLAFFAMVFVIVGSVLGAAARVGKVTSATHYGMLAFAIALNLFAFRMEFRTIKKNQALMRKLNDEIDSQKKPERV